MTEPLFEKVAIVGLGLIGSSVARALKCYGGARHISGHDADEGVRARANRIDLVDDMAETAAGAATGADLVMICVPVGAYASVMDAIAPALAPGSIVTDVGSVKGRVVEAVLPRLPEGVHFVPGHPIAGTEHSGPEAGFAELFDGRWCILTPGPDAPREAVERVVRLWSGFGSSVEEMDIAHHDLVLAITSHLPHLIAYNIVGTAADLEEVTRSEVIKFSASGFRDFTRIAASDPVMWRDIFLANKEAVLEMLGRFSEDLAALQRSIRWEDGQALEDLFTRTRAIRRGIVEAGQDTSEPDFGREHRILGDAGGKGPG